MKREIKLLRQERDQELLRCYHAKMAECYATSRRINRTQIVRETLSDFKPYFYIDSLYAYRIVKRMKDMTISRRATTSLRRKMWLEFKSHVDEIMQKRPNISLPNAVNHVLRERKASRFFVSFAYAYRLIYNISSSYVAAPKHIA